MRLRIAEIVLASVALLVAAFLTWERARGRAAPCPIGGGGCETRMNDCSFSVIGYHPCA